MPKNMTLHAQYLPLPENDETLRQTDLYIFYLIEELINSWKQSENT